MKTAKYKIYARVQAGDAEDISIYADKFGITKSGVIALCVAMGLNYLRAVTNPESLVSADKMAQIFEAASKRGVEFKMPDELIK